MQRPGFNVECRENNRVRWGFCNNCPEQECQVEDNDDADATIGIGLTGQSTGVEMGAGWTRFFTSCNADEKTFKRVWISVRNV